MNIDHGGSGFFGGWRGLARFWILIVAIAALGVAALTMMGPPEQAKPVVAAAAEHKPGTTPAAARPADPPAARPAAGPATAERPGRDTPGPIADPDPALLEASPSARDDMLPRVSADGRRPSSVYAAGFDRTSIRARVGLILGGIGMNEADSLAAARNLPGGITFAISPSTANLDKLLSAMRLAGHEYLLSIPMEPVEFPLNDPGPQALMTNLPPERNTERLHWAMSRLGGYAGATNAFSTMRGERFSGLPDQMAMVLHELDARGLVFVDARIGQAQPAGIWGRTIDVIIDEAANREDIEAKLEVLSHLALDRGSALGMATVPRPLTIERIAAWSNSLMSKGLILAPVTALVLPPPSTGAAK